MARLLLAAATGIAAAVLSAPPAAAQQGSASGPPRFVSPGQPFQISPGICRSYHRDRHGEILHRDYRCGPVPGGFAYADGQWALYNNRSWEPNSYNDWWHDRPDRAYPRWVQQQQQRGGPCDRDRMWWSGAGWQC